MVRRIDGNRLLVFVDDQLGDHRKPELRTEVFHPERESATPAEQVHSPKGSCITTRPAAERLRRAAPSTTPLSDPSSPQMLRRRSRTRSWNRTSATYEPIWIGLYGNHRIAPRPAAIAHSRYRGSLGFSLGLQHVSSEFPDEISRCCVIVDGQRDIRPRAIEPVTKADLEPLTTNESVRAEITGVHTEIDSLRTDISAFEARFVRRLWAIGASIVAATFTLLKLFP